MARMIPPDIPSDAPAGEAILFNKLRDDPGTEGWVVLHSLELRRHRTKAEGEIDMVILAPGLGALCLEVKGCDVSRKDGLWVYPYGTSVEGPFRQASRAMHSMRDYIQKRDPSLTGLLYWSAVAFTRIRFNEESPEWHPWQVIDLRTLGRKPISEIISGVIEKAHRHIGSGPGGRGWYDRQRSRPTVEQVRRLTGLLRGNFECVVQPRSDIQRIEESLLRLTEEQYDALDAVQENPRMIIKGLAGTGKTLLAIEAARRAVTEGKNVLLLCYNRLLGEWLKSLSQDMVQGKKGHLRCVHLHGLLRELAGDYACIRNDQNFWRYELPIHVIDCLLSDGQGWHQFDLLLVDEAQDILADEYLDVLDLLVKGGLAGGQWVLFGDFERQAIYLNGGKDASAEALAALRQRAPNHASFGLRVNCRNAGPIVETLTLACNVSPGYSRFLHEMEGSSVDPLFWSNAEDQCLKLDQSVAELRTIFHVNEIVVLSLNADDRSCAHKNSANQPGRYIPLRESDVPVTRVRYASVHAFKGLEAPAIIVTDIVRLDEQSRSLLYVAMSRARIRLTLLMQEACRKEYVRMLEAGLTLSIGK
ncbi:ATP-binding domain-containing protein [Methylocaldum sp. 14B]|uniref:nuclease-related domain-containing DEAD/DEAH box helicase n=1 Tax=Methylocaldum sp. 14B TaxID=1912213 RepID=UPI00143C4FED|nr:ATP-binding domain-containing protein [Methylocaldum sp. 14B]